MNKDQKRRVLTYLFLAIAVLTTALIYTIESWRWGALAVGTGLLFIIILTWIGLRKNKGG